MSTNPNNTYEEWLTAIASTAKHEYMSYARTLFSLQNEL